jgi:hypothetical protein
MLRFTCPSCGVAASAPEACAGRTTKCRQCGKPLTVPHAPSGEDHITASAIPEAPRQPDLLRGRSHGHEEGADELPELPKLGSLAQKARGKQLNQARWILIVIGALTVIVNGALMATLRDSIRNEIKKEIAKAGPGAVVDQGRVRQIEEQAYRVGMLAGGVAVVLGVIFIVCGIIIKMFPVPVTIISLVLYVLAALGFAALDPKTPGAGLIVKIIVVVALVKAIQAALVYEREGQKLETA